MRHKKRWDHEKIVTMLCTSTACCLFSGTSEEKDAATGTQSPLAKAGAAAYTTMRRVKLESCLSEQVTAGKLTEAQKAEALPPIKVWRRCPPTWSPPASPLRPPQRLPHPIRPERGLPLPPCQPPQRVRPAENNFLRFHQPRLSRAFLLLQLCCRFAHSMLD